MPEGKGGTDDLIEAQARKKAQALVDQASQHIALEGQALFKQKNRRHVEPLTDEFVHTLPSDLWDELSSR